MSNSTNDRSEIPKLVGEPWSRKHDKPSRPFIESTDCIVYPSSLKELIELCRDRPPGERFKAAGSHWGLSLAAVSDHTFIETHDPNGRFKAMARTLDDIIPKRLHPSYVEQLHLDSNETIRYLFHVEAGKRVYQLYAELDQETDVNDPNTLAGVIKQEFHNSKFTGPWALATAGNAGGQTIAGAVSTGTHGSDFDRPPLADAVLAIHLVVDGGKHYWIEAVSPTNLPLADESKLRETYGIDELGGQDNFEVIRKDDVFDAVLVNAGRFGVIYSMVLQAVPQYALHERRRLDYWQAIKGLIAIPTSPLYRDAIPPTATARQRALQIAVSLTPHGNFQLNRVGITRRWTSKLTDNTPGRAERVGDKSPMPHPITQAHTFEHAGNSHPYNPHPEHPEQADEPSILQKACAERSFLKGVVDQVTTEIKEFVESNGAVVGSTIAAVAAFAGGALLSLLLVFAAILLLLQALRAALETDDTRFGEAMEKIKDTLLDPSGGVERQRAGLFAWQMIYLLAFESQQKERDYDAIGYAVTDQKDYLNQSCEANVDSIEVFFDSADSRLIAFVDALIAFEIQQEIAGQSFVGYASLRFMGPSRALIGMQRYFPFTCSVEVACLKDVSGGQALLEYAIALARHPSIGGIFHWGQRHDLNRSEIERIFGTGPPGPGGTLRVWRDALALLSGDRDGFSSAFTVRTGLEPS